MILTVDSGTSVTKVSLWDRRGVVAEAGVALETRHPAPAHAEQDPRSWWTSVVAACGDLAGRVPDAMARVEVVGCTGARQTVAPVDGAGQPTGPGILWSDRRAEDEVAGVAARAGVEAGAPSPAGIVLDGASVAAKLAWLSEHHAEGLAAAAWLLTPRDLVVWHLTGTAVTDATMASRSGLYDLDGRLVEGLAGPAGAKLPPVVPPDRVTGPLRPEAAAALHLPTGLPVVIGAGDRACEVLGTGAAADRPMVSWGTTANVSIPVAGRPTSPDGIVVSRGAGGGWLLEGGLSAAGSLLAWLARVTGRTPDDLAAVAGGSPPGARGVVAAPWLDGARAPWWRPGASAGFVGIGPPHGPADLARALFEGVGWDVARCLEAMAARRPAGRPPTELVLGGSRTAGVWPEVLTGVTGLPASHRRSAQAASAGAARLAAAAAGLDWDADLADPVAGRVEPDPRGTDAYCRLRSRADAAARCVVDLPAPGEQVPCG